MRHQEAIELKVVFTSLGGLLAMLNNVKDFGATGDGATDDRRAIQGAIDDAVATNKGGILFPSGTYRVSRATALGDRWSLDLSGVQDFVVMGEGPSSIVKLMDTAAPTDDWHVFILRNNCQRVVFTDLAVDGNRTGLMNPGEQSHGIEVEDGTEDLIIDRCILRECFGDGVRLLGRAQAGGGLHVKRVRIENCLFQANKRSGLGIQRALEQIVVANCMFDGTVSDQSIDFEPTGREGPTDLLIQGCIINHTNDAVAVSLSGISGSDPMVRCKFTDNIVLGGGIFCTDVAQLTIQNNIVVVTDLVDKQRIPVEVQRGGDAVVISGNLVINDSTVTEAAISVKEANMRQVTRALIVDNLCFARFGSGIQCLSSDDVMIQSNVVVATVPAPRALSYAPSLPAWTASRCGTMMSLRKIWEDGRQGFASSPQHPTQSTMSQLSGTRFAVQPKVSSSTGRPSRKRPYVRLTRSAPTWSSHSSVSETYQKLLWSSAVPPAEATRAQIRAWDVSLPGWVILTRRSPAMSATSFSVLTVELARPSMSRSWMTPRKLAGRRSSCGAVTYTRAVARFSAR